MLRLLRDPAVTRVLAAAVVLGLLAVSAPVLLPLVRWGGDAVAWVVGLL